MRILCRNGHIAFYPKDESEIFRFASFFGETPVRDGDFYTFEFLKDAPKYSIKGKTYLGVVATKTFEGEPWEVMRENNLVYSLNAGTVVLKTTITMVINPQNAEGFFLAESPIIQPGSLSPSGQRVLSYDAEYFGNTSQLRVFEVEYG